VTFAAAVPHAVRAPSRVHVLVGGDVMPHRPQLESPASVSAALTPLEALFQTADATIVNFESATGSTPPISARMSLVASPEWMRAVTRAHVTGLSLANNHACDLGTRGLDASIEAAGSLGVAALGVSDDDPWRAVVIATSNGQKLCAVAWTTFLNSKVARCATTGELALAKPNRSGRLRVARAVAAAYHDGCDSVIAIAHGGDEYAPQTDAMMTMARAAADAGADAVIFHHPHVVSPLVVYDAEDGRHVPIFASVGNLVSNQGESWTSAYPATQSDRHLVYMNGWTRVGMIADLDVRLDATPHIAAFGYHLVFVETDHVLDKSNPHPHIATRTLDPERDHAVIAKLSRDDPAVFEDPCWMEAERAASPTCR
jgi:poly-gamma-glutamate synthesis protein (capsule biosynthesis protein)